MSAPVSRETVNLSTGRSQPRRASEITLTPEQLSAWRLQLPVLRGALLALAPPAAGPAPWICLEFDIPRLGRRVDAVLFTADAVVPIEFKVGARKFERPNEMGGCVRQWS